MDENGNFLKVDFDYSPNIWPWSSYFAVKLSVTREAINFDGFAEGQIILTIESNEDNTAKIVSNELKLYIKAKIIPEPPRQQRILWDQYHNLRYPSGYFPRDDLKRKKNPLDWNADHVINYLKSNYRVKCLNVLFYDLKLHTNFRDLYQYLRNAGYFIDILGQSFNCFDATKYG